MFRVSVGVELLDSSALSSSSSSSFSSKYFTASCIRTSERSNVISYLSSNFDPMKSASLAKHPCPNTQQPRSPDFQCRSILHQSILVSANRSPEHVSSTRGFPSLQPWPSRQTASIAKLMPISRGAESWEFVQKKAERSGGSCRAGKSTQHQAQS
jgi:hypothetical protein